MGESINDLNTRLSAVTSTVGTIQTTIPLINGRIDAVTGDVATLSSNTLSTGDVQTQIDSSISGKVDTTAFTSYSASVETALSGKQDTLSAGTNITIVDNVISAEGGGKAIEAGRGISVTTGETADTVSFNLPISADSNTYINAGVGNTNNDTTQNILIGSGNTAYNGTTATNSGATAIGFGNRVGYHAWSRFNQSYSFALGYNNVIQGGHSYAIGRGNNIGSGTSNSKDQSFLIGFNNTCTFNGDSNGDYIFGKYCTVSKSDEFALGKYNASNTGSTDADKTFFSIGNGTADNARHNAFEIRQDGSIYLNDGTNDVKLQDTITATASNTTALGGLSLVKLTSAEYESLTNKDSNTLYIISD